MPLSSKRAVAPPAIPDRLYFKIGDVARICEVETYVLRFWETQFPQLKPNKSGTGQRLYRRRDVELALRIKQLVHDEGYTLAGARQALEHPSVRRQLPAADPLPAAPGGDLATTIVHARGELREIAALLANPEPQPPPPRRRARLTTLPSLSGSLFPSD
ncbi:MAG: MerR family transcriptional regulator [Terracidiphilus sp.]